MSCLLAVLLTLTGFFLCLPHSRKSRHHVPEKPLIVSRLPTRADMAFSQVLARKIGDREIKGIKLVPYTEAEVTEKDSVVVRSAEGRSNILG